MFAGLIAIEIRSIVYEEKGVSKGKSCKICQLSKKTVC